MPASVWILIISQLSVFRKEGLFYGNGQSRNYRFGLYEPGPL